MDGYSIKYDFCNIIFNNNFSKLKSVLLQISKIYDIKLHFISTTDEYFDDYYFNNSTSTNDTIIIGIYDDIDLLVASFFHELGHIVQNYDYNDMMLKFHIELNAWNFGLNIGLDYGYYIKPETYKKCMKMLYSYIDYEILEQRYYKETQTYQYYNENKQMEIKNTLFVGYETYIEDFNVNCNR